MRAFVAEVERSVPAYRDFLLKQGAEVQGPWEELPLTTKSNYLLAYPTDSLCRGGSLAGCHLIGASSGFSRTGSIFWPKRPGDERKYVEGIEQLLMKYYSIHEKRTLVFVCLAFGTWIAGIQLATAVRSLAATGRHPVALSTPGLNLSEAVNIYEQFSSHFDQVIWITNPSNVNIIMALVERSGVALKPGSIFFPVVGEYYPEAFRINVAKRLGHDPEEPFCVWTGYGSADAGDLGVETAETIRLRKFFYSRPHLSKEFFQTANTPMMLEPSASAFIEVLDDRIVATKDQMVPLVRYDTGDTGGMLERADLAKVRGLPGHLLESLPGKVLYVRGRVSDAIVFYGTNLCMGDVNDYLLSLSRDFEYGGLFQVRQELDKGYPVFLFTIQVTGKPDEALRHRYYAELIGFLKRQSLEFTAKYDTLSRSAGEPLIRIDLELLDTGRVNLKHRFIVED